MSKLSVAEYERLGAEASYRVLLAQEKHLERMRALELQEKEAQVRKAAAEAETQEKIRSLVLEVDRVSREVLAALADLREVVEAKLEALRQQSLEYQQLVGGGECVVCSALLLPPIDIEPPHCWDCAPTAEHREEWDARLHELASSLRS